jgi:hypothetical protein
MGSLRNFLTDMQKLASVNPKQELEKQAEYKTLMALSMLKEAQELAEMAAAEEVPPEAAVAPEGMGGEEMGGEMDEEALIDALTELVNNVDTLDETEQGSVLDAADALEDEEAAAGEKTSTVMDYVALLNYLGIR